MQLSIVVPVWNRASVVRRTLDSIAASTHRGFELLIVDNGSTDDSLAVCERWAWDHRDDGFPIRVLTELQHGASVARNRGLMECRTEYVYFFDSDDLFSSDFVSMVLPALDGLVDVLCVPVCQEVEGRRRQRAYRVCSDVHVHLLNSMLNTLSMVLRTEYLRKIGGWNEALTTWDDWELGVRVLLGRPRLVWMEEKVFHCALVHEESQTGESFTVTLPAIGRAMRAVLVVLQGAKMTERERRKTNMAYYLRCMIYAGMFRREKNVEGERAMQALATACVPHPALPLQHVGGLMKMYVWLGGRGAWRAALALVP